MRNIDLVKDELSQEDLGLEQTSNTIMKICSLRSYHLHSNEAMLLNDFTNYLILYTQSGKGSVSTGTDSVSLEESSILFLNASAIYELSCSDTLWSFILIEISGSPVAYYRELLLSNFMPYNIPLFSSLPKTFEQLKILFEKENNKDTLLIESALSINKYLTDILTELTLFIISDKEICPRIPSYIREMKNMFDNEYSNYYSLDQLEAHFSISKYRLCREFSKYCQCSPLQYLNQVRIKEAQELLLTTNLLIHEVGTCVGIENTNHFINLFKKYTGVTPLAFKQSN